LSRFSFADCWNKTYHGAPVDGGVWNSGNCSRRVLRGGFWYDYPRNMRAANRTWDTTSGWIGGGFRIARTLPDERQRQTELPIDELDATYVAVKNANIREQFYILFLAVAQCFASCTILNPLFIIEI
jgi:hypothetical protein|tara:strand:- start:102 stop:482 length:381 start_codon:yes stop_codon:yes gene_type:complete